MQNYYKIDFYKLLIQLLPTQRRKPKFMALMSIIASQLQKIHYEFFEFIGSYQIKGQSQKCKLEYLINKWFDPYHRRIKLRNIKPDFDSLLLWKQDSNMPQMISNEVPFLIQTNDNLLMSQFSFEVVLPIGFTLTDNEMALLKEIVNENKLPSKKYRITNG